MKPIFKQLSIWTLVVSLTVVGGSIAFAGPYIFSGTDSDDHGFELLGTNQDGWLFMQKALENLGPAVTNGKQVVTILGSQLYADEAANSAFNLSNLAGVGGWTIQNVSTGNFATFFGSGGGLENTGILMMDSGINVTGGVDGTVFDPYATAINSFLGNGGGLFSQANGYSWVSTLVPGLTVTDGGFGGVNAPLSLTAAGSAAFPGLTNNDLSTGPWHNYFSNTGSIPVLATSPFNNVDRAVIIGASAGSITNPGGPGTNVPEPASLVLLSAGLFGAAAFRRMKA